MQQANAIKLLEQGIRKPTIQQWADLGCGAGTFTMALAALLAPGSYIHALDKQQQSLPKTANQVNINYRQANFITNPLPLTGLDGVLMANSFHYVKDKEKLIHALKKCFTQQPQYLFVEYDTTSSNPWVPYPIPFASLELLFNKHGYQTKKLAEQVSRFGGTMYSALVWV